jgi:NAD(P)-dependent dehydrogenase (short-subunit alcohol dehydrogenase family)
MGALTFDGRVAVITGAGAGLGRLYALDLAKRGARVVVNDFSRAAADKTVSEIRAAGGEAVANYSDVVDGAAVVQSAIDAFGGVHIVVNNAGVLRDVSFARMSAEQWDAVINTHLRGTFAVCKAAWAPMREQNYGRIVNITSVNGLYGQVGQANYAAAKSAMVGFTKTLAQEGRSRGIIVNAVAPGAGTAMTATIMPADLVAAWKPDYVAPFVTCLCHEVTIARARGMGRARCGATASKADAQADGQHQAVPPLNVRAPRRPRPSLAPAAFRRACRRSRAAVPRSSAGAAGQAKSSMCARAGSRSRSETRASRASLLEQRTS